MARVIPLLLIVGCGASDRQTYKSLHEAVSAQDLAAVKRQLANGADPNAFDASSEAAPLIQAVVLNNVPIAEALLKAGANPEVTLGKDFINKIVASARAGNEGSLAWIRQHKGVKTVDDFVNGPYLAGHEKTTHMSVLWSAASKGQTEMVRLLLRFGASTKNRATAGNTVLHAAARSGDAAAVDLLLDAGSDIEAFDDAGGTPLATAASLGQVDAMRVLLDAGADPHNGDQAVSAVETAASFGMTRSLAFFAERNVQINLPRRRGVTPLHLTAMNGHIDSLKFLLDHGADPNARTDNNGTALQFAARSNQLAAVQALIEAGADPNIPSDDGLTPRAAAAEKGFSDIVEFLDSLDAK